MLWITQIELIIIQKKHLILFLTRYHGRLSNNLAFMSQSALFLLLSPPLLLFPPCFATIWAQTQGFITSPLVSQHLETRGESNTIRADVSRHGVSIYRSKTFRSPMVSNSIHTKHNCRFRLTIVDNCGLTSKVIYFPDKHAVVFRSKAVINKKNRNASFRSSSGRNQAVDGRSGISIEVDWT